MSDEIKKTVLNTLAEPIANSAKNITDKPTQNIGTTLADIWYLVFGGISQIAEKRKLRIAYSLKKMEEELKDDISKISQDKITEPDIQIIAQALEASKYCIEKDKLRHMFVKLISKSLNIETTPYVHPSFIDIISQLSSYDATILTYIHQYNINSKLNITINSDELLFTLSSLEHQGLIHASIEQSSVTLTINKDFISMNEITNSDIITKIACVTLTKLGEIFCNVCLSDNN